MQYPLGEDLGEDPPTDSHRMEGVCVPRLGREYSCTASTPDNVRDDEKKKETKESGVEAEHRESGETVSLGSPLVSCDSGWSSDRCVVCGMCWCQLSRAARVPGAPGRDRIGDCTTLSFKTLSRFRELGSKNGLGVRPHYLAPQTPI